MHDPIAERAHPFDLWGFQRLYRFPNGYGASAVRFRLPSFIHAGPSRIGSYTDGESEWEVAIVHFPDESVGFDIVYDSPIKQGGIVGYVADESLSALLDQIAALPSR